MTDEKYKRLLKAAIPSSEVRNYCQKLNRNFSPTELSTLIYQNYTLPESDKIDFLRSIQTELENDPNPEENSITANGKLFSPKEIANQIKKYIDTLMEMERFLYSETDGIVYELECERKVDFVQNHEDTIWHDRCGMFSSIDKVLSKMKSIIEKDKNSGYAPMSFIVRKYFIDNSDDYVSGTFFIKHAEPVLLRLCSSFIDKGLYSNEFFTDFFVSVPHPFRNGDIVRTIEVCEKEYLGVVNNIPSDMAFFSWLKTQEEKAAAGNRDISDIGVSANYFEDGTFHYEPLYFFPTMIEKIGENELNSEKNEAKNEIDILKEAALLVSGDGSLEYFCSLLKGKENE